MPLKPTHSTTQSRPSKNYSQPVSVEHLLINPFRSSSNIDLNASHIASSAQAVSKNVRRLSVSVYASLASRLQARQVPAASSPDEVAFSSDEEPDYWPRNDVSYTNENGQSLNQSSGFVTSQFVTKGDGLSEESLLVVYRDRLQLYHLPCQSQEWKLRLVFDAKVAGCEGSIVCATYLPLAQTTDDPLRADQKYAKEVPLVALGINFGRTARPSQSNVIFYSLLERKIVHESHFEGTISFIKANARYIVIGTTEPVAVHILHTHTLEHTERSPIKDVVGPVPCISLGETRLLAYTSNHKVWSETTPRRHEECEDRFFSPVNRAQSATLARKVSQTLFIGAKTLGEYGYNYFAPSQLARSAPAKTYHLSEDKHMNSEERRRGNRSSPNSPSSVGDIDSRTRLQTITVADLQTSGESGIVSRFTVQCQSAITFISLGPQADCVFVASRDADNFALYALRAGFPSASGKSPYLVAHLQRGFSRSRILDVAWSAESDRVAILTHKGTWHIYTLPGLSSRGGSNESPAPVIQPHYRIKLPPYQAQNSAKDYKEGLWRAGVSDFTRLPMSLHFLGLEKEARSDMLLFCPHLFTLALLEVRYSRRPSVSTNLNVASASGIAHLMHPSKDGLHHTVKPRYLWHCPQIRDAEDHADIGYSVFTKDIPGQFATERQNTGHYIAQAEIKTYNESGAQRSMYLSHRFSYFTYSSKHDFATGVFSPALEPAYVRKEVVLTKSDSAESLSDPLHSAVTDDLGTLPPNHAAGSPNHVAPMFGNGQVGRSLRPTAQASAKLQQIHKDFKRWREPTASSNAPVRNPEDIAQNNQAEGSNDDDEPVGQPEAPSLIIGTSRRTGKPIIADGDDSDWQAWNISDPDLPMPAHHQVEADNDDTMHEPFALDEDLVTSPTISVPVQSQSRPHPTLREAENSETTTEPLSLLEVPRSVDSISSHSSSTSKAKKARRKKP